MIVTDRFVFLHLHKSGGTFVNEFLRTFFPKHKAIGYHLPRSMLPDQYRHLPLLGVVRNPWSYYVSWYVFQSTMGGPNGLFRTVSENQRLDFGDTIGNLVCLGEDPVHFDAFQALLPARFRRRGLNLTKSCVEPLRGSPEGFYTFLYRRLFGDEQGVHIIQLETLRDGLLRFLRGVGVHVTPKMERALRRWEKKNSTQHRHFTEYYDDRLAQLVTHRDQHVIERFDYRFEGPGG